MRMKWTREISRKVNKLYLINENMTDGLKQAILEIAENYPQNTFNQVFKNIHNYTKGISHTGTGPGINYTLGFLDAAKGLNLDISLCIQGTKDWSKNTKREQAINEWLIQNT